VGDAAERNPAVPHDPVRHVQRGGDRDERERVRGAVAHLAVPRAARQRQRWQVDGGDQVAVREDGVLLGSILG
jgi:hypothetical protein